MDMIRPAFLLCMVLAAACSTMRVRVPLSSEDAASANKELGGGIAPVKELDAGIAWVKLRDEAQGALRPRLLHHARFGLLGAHQSGRNAHVLAPDRSSGSAGSGRFQAV